MQRKLSALAIGLSLLTLAARVEAQHAHHVKTDSAEAALQARGALLMGVAQDASTHTFDALPDGGRLRYVMNEPDDVGTATIRAHLRAIAAAFAQGDFSTPAHIHAQHVPGTDVMAAHRNSITYTVTDIPNGAELRMRTDNPEVVQAIARFMAFQRSEHRAGGHP